MRKKTDSKKDLQDILANASPRQKAILVCLHGTDAPAEDITLTTEDEAAIKRSLTDYRERREYYKWIDYYNVYVKTTPMCGLVVNTFKYSVMLAFTYVSQWERWKTEENFINILLTDIEEKAPAAADDIRKAINTLQPTHAAFKDFFKVHIDKKGFVKIDTDKIYNNIKERIAYVYENYSVMKAFIIAQEEWTKKHRSAAIMPTVLKKTLTEAKEEWSLVAGRQYSRKYLAMREDRGEKISLAERKKALFPCYDDIEVNETYVALWREKIKEEEDAVRQQ